MAATSIVRRFGIYSPTMGLREDFPSILLEKNFTPDCSNVQIWNGELRKAKLRSPELVRTVRDIVLVSTTSETITISGDHTTEFLAGDTVVAYHHSTQDYIEYTLSTNSYLNVTSNTVLTVTGDVTSATPTEYLFNSNNVASVDPANALFRCVQAPDGNAIILYKWLTTSAQTERLLAFTKDHIYYWNYPLSRWTTLFTCSASCDLWSADVYGDYIVATNDVDRPQYWAGDPAADFQTLDTRLSATTSDYIAKAKFVKVYKNYVWLGNVELSDGQRYQHHGYWCNVGEGVAANGWRQDTGGDAGSTYIDGDGEIAGGFGLWQDYLIVFKRRSIRKFWYTGGAIPFSQASANDAVGCYAPNSVVNDKNGRLYYFGSDGLFREMTLDVVCDATDLSVRSISRSAVAKIAGAAIDEYDEMWWAIPYGPTATANNKILVFKTRELKWEVRDIDVVAFGRYKPQSSWTWDTLPFATWDSWGWDSWDSGDGSVGYPQDLCSDSEGNTFNSHGAYTDKGDAYDSYFVLTTDLTEKRSLPFYKRVLQIFVYARREGTGTLSLYMKNDQEGDWQSLGTVSLTGTDEALIRQRLAVDQRGKSFLLKAVGTSVFSFVGVEFEFLALGPR